jgi:tetratricopeptide (TPR) repeat protein
MDIPVEHTVIDEDWEGLYANIKASNLKDKDQMVQDLRAEKNTKKRQEMLQSYINGNGLFEASLLPPLRRSVISLHTEGEKLTGSTAKTIMEKDPSTMSLNDRLCATAEMTDANKKIESYKAIIKKYPDDWRAYNNLATIYLHERKWEEASSLIDQSIKIQEHPENKYNQGFIHLAKGNISSAKTCFSNVSSSSEWSSAKGAAEILNGNYSEAVSIYGNTISNNAALAQILNKDYSKAASTLSRIETQNATTYYLKAIVGARTNDKNMVYNNLKEVMSRDKTLGESAKTDIEFAGYMKDSRFTSILQ